MNAHCYILLGGFFGADGFITSAGMYGLKAMLSDIVPCSVYQWADYHSAANAIATDKPSKVIVIGYSGGGSRATWLADDNHQQIIDLMVLYDPSPRWQMVPIGQNVRKAITYHNKAPMFFGLGGGVLTGKTDIETIDISENHIVVQSDIDLHNRTVAAVKNLVG